MTRSVSAQHPSAWSQEQNRQRVYPKELLWHFLFSRIQRSCGDLERVIAGQVVALPLLTLLTVSS